MTEHTSGYAVFLYDEALTALGDAIKPYMQDGPQGKHIPCQAVDTAGGFVEMTLRTPASDDGDTEIELMVPGGMVRMIVSMHNDIAFGFARSDRDAREPRQNALPVVGPKAPAAEAPSTAMPHAVQPSGPNSAVDDRREAPEG